MNAQAVCWSTDERAHDLQCADLCFAASTSPFVPHVAILTALEHGRCELTPVGDEAG